MQGLFSEFPGSSYAEWEKQVLKDLKGESPEHLLWMNENGIKVKPYFNSDSLPGAYEPAFTHSNWQVAVEHTGTSKELNQRFLRDLSHGANAIAFDLGEHSLEIVLKDIQLDLISLSIRLQPGQVARLKHYLDSHYAGKELNISLFPVSMRHESELQEWMALEPQFTKHKGILSTSVQASEFVDQGALPYYELALTFTLLIETLSRSDSASVFHRPIAVRTCTDTDFFVQIAKLRAYRRLWKLIAKEYNCAAHLYIVAETSINSLSVTETYTNLLRTTLSSMAAILGGCNELIAQPYDRLLQQDAPFSSRLAMNQQFILKHESYFDKLGDVACGSYYTEYLTDALCERALSAIKAIESKGGYFTCLASGEIGQELEKQNKDKLEAVTSGKNLRVGVNKFRNEKEPLKLNAEQMQLLKVLAPHHPLLNYELFQTTKA